MRDEGPASASLAERQRTHAAIASRLAALSDDALAALLADTGSWRTNGHGNQSGVIDIEGARVFVKKIALTDVERAGQIEGSTANAFDLPLFYQYGVGSAGFGAWRELSACLRASAWALAGELPHFPLVCHWRVLPRPVRWPLTDEQADRLQRGVDYWGGSDAVRARLEAICAASASIVLFIEHAPATLAAWLEGKLAGEGPDAALEAAILRLHDQWREAADFMNARGMLHFDLHAHNLLTDGERLYVADFGLAICADFELSPAERLFFETHRHYDRCYVDWAFAAWLGLGSETPPVLTPALRARVDHCAPVVKVFGGFLRTLRSSKTTPYPAAELKAALAAQALLSDQPA